MYDKLTKTIKSIDEIMFILYNLIIIKKELLQIVTDYAGKTELYSQNRF